MKKLAVFACVAALFLVVRMTGAQNGAADITVDTSKPINSFSPPRALGGSIDRQRAGGLNPTQQETEAHTNWVMSGVGLKELMGSGWQTVTYRQNTELQIEAWHWNPHGTWSNAAKKEGYFVGDAEPTSEKIEHGWAYPLPHRGATVGDGNGWSRITDGDEKSYWKSNPYLTKMFTGENDSLHPQWVMIDLGARTDINAMKIAWANPYATRYYVQFWTGDLEPFYAGINRGSWQTFPMGTVTRGHGGTPLLKLSDWPINARYLRIWMKDSSNTCDTHGSEDKRNCVGYAINELYIGSETTDGQFTDIVKHSPNRQQTITWPSSVDPWHRASDLDYGRGDQIGFDLFFNSGVTRTLPTMMPIAIVYNVPEDAANEIAYLYKRKYPISWIEMGEEADGQRILPEDYATLYVQFARAIHKLEPTAKLGGPSFEGTPGDVDSWADANGRVSFLGRFLDYLRSHNAMQDFTFFSFEHYPCMGTGKCTDWSSLEFEPDWVNHLITAWHDNGLPANIPFFMTEGNDLGEGNPGTVKAGLWLADYVGSMMSAGAGGTYYFHYIAGQGRGGRGGLVSVDDNDHATYTPQYFASQLITQEWVQPVDKIHKLYKADSEVKDSGGHVLVTAYPIARPDGEWSIMFINKDQDNDHSVRVEFADPATKQAQYFTGSVERAVFGPNEYVWHPDPPSPDAAAQGNGSGRGGRGNGGGNGGRGRGPSGHPDPDGPLTRSTVTASGADTVYNLPKASVIVLRGKIAAK
jgi:hypothetical protein